MWLAIFSRFIILFIVHLSFIFLLTAQTHQKEIVLEHADSLVGKEIDGEPCRLLYGNVRFRQGTILVTCENAIQYLRSNKLMLDGEVVVVDDTIRMVTHRGIYYGDSRIVEVFDEVRVEDGTSELRAKSGKYFMNEKKFYFFQNVLVEDTASSLASDELTYYRDQKRTIADGNVIINDYKSKMKIFGGHFEHDKITGYGKMTKQPEAIQVQTSESGDTDTFLVKSEIMESFRDTLPQLRAYGQVSISYNGFLAIAETSVYYTQLDSVILRYKPIIWYLASSWETTQVSGDSMFMKLRDQKPQILYVKGNALAITTADSLYKRRYHQLTGQEMKIFFENNTIDKIEVNKTVTMVYYLFEDFRGNGLNTTTGDYVLITFNDRQINQIKVVGGVEGKYYPENLVRGREHEYNLPNFKWQTHLMSDRRIVHTLDKQQ